MVHRAAPLALLLSIGCGPASSGKGAEEPTREHGVAAAELPHKVLRAEGGQEISDRTLISELAEAEAVCIGEAHPNPHHHWVQLTLLERLLERNQEAGVTTALGMEMFQRPFQGVLDDYAAGRIDEETLLSRAGWDERWGYDWGLYSPMVELAVRHGAELLALNVSSELKEKVSERGVEDLSPPDRERIPELNLEDPDHRAWWNDIMASMGGARGHGEEGGEEGEAPEGEKPPDHPAPEHEASGGGDAGVEEGEGEEEAAAGGHEGNGEEGEEEDGGEEPSFEEKAERMYSVQVLWDETMAESAASWLSEGGQRQVVILAGNGHCHESAVVRRLERRGVSNVVSVRPVIDKGEGRVSSFLADPENDYLFVMRIPE